ncbi:MAG: anti-sigma regulatory factor [Candidatus Eisenbacteria bacterium]|uniref:Anti-sigma regulatory factor n=1 Tax=Eiseniibacteriota bacterium TaxID=2212470 RepID=A0A538U6X2_UNCEI|nr:MAG: anti-sigma regulatory factor [Candidatus Eisenbacteria bacterium]
MSPLVQEGVGRVRIDGDRGIVSARQRGRALALGLGFSSGGATLVATAISELARNILLYAGQGEIDLRPLERGGNPGLVIVARDRGPGIDDIRRAMEDGYSTSGRLGLGLPGVRRLMDQFEIVSTLGVGTEVRAVKWRHP